MGFKLEHTYFNSFNFHKTKEIFTLAIHCTRYLSIVNSTTYKDICRCSDITMTNSTTYKDTCRCSGSARGLGALPVGDGKGLGT